MLTLQQLNSQVLTPALQLLPNKMDTSDARVELLAITQQEDKQQERVQRNGGPAHGLWQFEKGGGVHGVLTHPASADLAESVCTARGVVAEEGAVWRALPTDDILAAALARLLLWTDPKPMARNASEGWGLYARVWRPGKPHPEVWDDNYARAQKAVQG